MAPSIQDVLDRIDVLETTLLAQFSSLETTITTKINTLESTLLDELDKSHGSRQERYNENDDNALSVYDNLWQGQTFTPTNAHTIVSVKLKLHKEDAPGTVYLGIRAVDVEGKPTGNNLAYATLDGDLFTTDPSGEWYEFILVDKYDLDEGVTYAIVLSAPNGSMSNRLRWRSDATSPTYNSGCACFSSNYGVTWNKSTGSDLMFEEYSESTGLESINEKLLEINSKLPEAKTG